MWGCGLSRSEWEERKLAFGVALLNGWDDSTSVLPRARHRLVLGSDDTLPRRSGVPRNVAWSCDRWMKIFLEREFGGSCLLGAWGSLLTEGFLAY